MRTSTRNVALLAALSLGLLAACGSPAPTADHYPPENPPRVAPPTRAALPSTTKTPQSQIAYRPPYSACRASIRKPCKFPPLTAWSPCAAWPCLMWPREMSSRRPATSLESARSTMTSRCSPMRKSRRSRPSMHPTRPRSRKSSQPPIPRLNPPPTRRHTRPAKHCGNLTGRPHRAARSCCRLVMVGGAPARPHIQGVKVGVTRPAHFEVPAA